MMATLTGSNFSQAKRYMLKVPVQKRSRETVSSIVESCARLLITTPYHEITTDKIAEIAGVSIGSLYQFFANKEAIVSAVIDDLLVKDIEFIREGLAKLPHGDLETKIRVMIDMGFSRFHTDRELRAALQNVQGLLDYWETRRVFFEHYQKYILQHIPELPGRDRDLVALIIVSTFNNALNINLLQQPQTPEREEKFKNEIFSLVSRYLKA
jgi:AcrR family transcriptional regulator